MTIYKNGKPVSLDDYVRVDSDSLKSFWGWVKVIREDGIIDLLDKSGKMRQVNSIQCSKASISKSTSNKKDIIERVIKVTSDVAKTKKRHRLC